MLEVFKQKSYQLHGEILLSQGIDYLSAFPELDEYTVEAADGHFIDHACHTEKNSKGKVYAAGGICALPYGRHYKVYLDGYNILPMLTGETDKSPRKEIVYFSDDGDLTA